MVAVKEKLLDTQEWVMLHCWLEIRHVLGTLRFPLSLLFLKVASRVSLILQEA